MRRGVEQSGAGAEPEGRVAGIDRVETRDATEPDDLFQVAKLLGDPEPDVRRPGQQHRVGVTSIKLGERSLARGGGEEGVAVADDEIAIVARGAQRLGAGACSRRETVRRRAVAGRQRRLDDRLVAGAAAEIARERLVDALARRRRAAMVVREQAHHDAGRAEAALRTVEIDHRLLHGVQRLALGEVLDGEQFGAVDLPEQQNAGIDRLVGELAAPKMRKHHRAGAAVALAAALLGPRRARLLAQPIEQRRPRRKTVQRAGFAAKAEGKVSSGIRSLCIRSHPAPLFAPISGIGDATAIGPIMAPNELERKCGLSIRRPVRRRADP